MIQTIKLIYHVLQIDVACHIYLSYYIIYHLFMIYLSFIYHLFIIYL